MVKRGAFGLLVVTIFAALFLIASYSILSKQTKFTGFAAQTFSTASPNPSASPSPTPSPIASPTPTASPRSTASPSPTASPIPSASPEASPTPSSCIDSDGEGNFDVAGKVTVNGQDNFDFCKGSYAYDYYCENNEISSTNMNCAEAGKICEDGVCKPEEAECRLLRAYWEKTRARNREHVNLVLKSENCIGKEAKFEILEKDILGSKKIETISKIIGEDTTIIRWRALWKNDNPIPLIKKLIKNNPEYKFKVSVNPEIESENMLIVSGERKIYYEDLDNVIKLSNSVIEIEFDKQKKGGISQITNLITGQEFVPSVSDKKLYEIEHKPEVIGTNSKIVSNLDASSFAYNIHESDDEIVLTINTKHADLQFDVTSKISLKKDSNLTYWRISVDNSGEKVIRSIIFPRIRVKTTLGQSPDDDELILPYFSGTLFRDLEKEETKSYVNNYPGKNSMQFMAYYDLNGGIFLSTFDSQGYKKYFGFERQKSSVPEENKLNLIYKHVFTQSIGNDFNMDYDFVLTGFVGDWYDATDIYKNWARQQWWAEEKITERDDVPEKFANTQAVIEGWTFLPKDWVEVVKFLQEKYRKPLDTEDAYSFEPNNLALVSGGAWSKYIDWTAIDYFEPDNTGNIPLEPIANDPLKGNISELDKIGVTNYLWFSTIQWHAYEKYGINLIDTSQKDKATIRMGYEKDNFGRKKDLIVGDKTTKFGNQIELSVGEKKTVNLYGNNDKIEVKLVSKSNENAKLEFYKNDKLFDTKEGKTGQYFPIELYYFNDTEDFNKYGKKWIIQNEAGILRRFDDKSLQSWAGLEDNLRNIAYICIGTDENNAMNNIIVDNVEKAIKRGARYISLDQTIGGHINGCWDKSHGHPIGEGKWTHDRFVNLLEKINQKIKELGKWGEVVITMEEPSEMYNQLLQSQMIVQTVFGGEFYTPGDKKIFMFDYVYKGTIIPYSSQGSHIGVNTPQGRWALGTKYVLGNVPGVTISWLNLTDFNSEIFKFHKKLVSNTKRDYRYSEHLNPPEFEYKYVGSNGWVSGLPEVKIEKLDPRNKGYDRNVWKNMSFEPIVTNTLKTPEKEISYLFVDTRESDPSKLSKPNPNDYVKEEDKPLYEQALELYKNEPVPKPVTISFELSDYDLGFASYELLKIIDGKQEKLRDLTNKDLPGNIEFTINPEEIVEFILKPITKCGNSIIDEGEACEPPGKKACEADKLKTCTDNTCQWDIADCNLQDKCDGQDYLDFTCNSQTLACSSTRQTCSSKCSAHLSSGHCCPLGEEWICDDCRVPGAGNGCAEPGENCGNSGGDIKCQSNEICYNGQCIKPACFSNQDCNDGDSCTIGVCENAGKYNAKCINTLITTCKSGDNCCPSACNVNNDAECKAVCNNNILEPGESCEPPGKKACEADKLKTCTDNTCQWDIADCNLQDKCDGQDYLDFTCNSQTLACSSTRQTCSSKCSAHLSSGHCCPLGEEWICDACHLPNCNSCSETECSIDCLKKIGCPIDFDKDGILDEYDKCSDTPKEKKVNKLGCTMPLFNNFKMAETTNLFELDLNKVENLTLDSRDGKILFKGKLNVVGVDFDKNVNITKYSIFVNITNLSQLNVSAVITLYNISFVDPKILIENDLCTDCSIIIYRNNILVFNVSHFTLYEVVEGYTPPSPPNNGGGGSVVKPKPKCKQNWTLGDWQSCQEGDMQYRDWIDMNKCSNDTGKPRRLSRTCDFCVPNWQCTEWSECLNAEQTRECADLNSCNEDETKPVENQDCSEKEKPKPSYLIYIIVTFSILVLIILVAIILISREKQRVGKTKKTELEKEKKDALEDAKLFIENSLKRGYTKEQIKIAFLNKGWIEKDIVELFDVATNN